MLNYYIDIKKYCFLLLATLTLGVYTFSLQAAHLDISDRPERLSKAIDKKFHGLVTRGNNDWGENGKDKYLIMGLDDDDVVKKMVDTHPDQKIFNFMDIGAGNHSWAKARVKFLNAEYAGRNIHFNIFSLAGDNYKEEGHIVNKNVNIIKKEDGLCSLYNLSAFPIEHMTAQLIELGYFEMLSQQLDIMVATYSLMHLVDPVGTFLQMYDLARPHQGLLFVENFFHINSRDNGHVCHFLARTKLECFKRYENNSFVIRRSDEKPAKFPYQYVDAKYDGERARAELLALKQEGEEYKIESASLNFLIRDYGSESLREWLGF